jgi:thioredoxin 1
MIKIIRFTASWCGPCKMLAPIFGEVQNEVSDVMFETIDVDINKDKSSQYLVSSVPTVIIEKDGQIVNRFSGVKPKNAIISLINQYK